ncbi:hypothetical protein PoB_006287700 [Plakobranchus ocellatus]|uniref:Uncharacterized protein n=1 Tax=Plakobranchus ocellatus TaxID=259542 RepID=A0AAV4CWS7_9GAST|nr:hypothetical protein PoB_006287700 [Plakobranchus ocellatus]
MDGKGEEDNGHSQWSLASASAKPQSPNQLPQQGDLRLYSPPSGRGVNGTRNRRVPADLRADSKATVPPKGKGNGHTQSVVIVQVGLLCLACSSRMMLPCPHFLYSP